MTEHPSDLLAALALDALTSDLERAEVERHVSMCPRCRQELDTLLGVAGAMGNLVEAPPAELWARIAASLHEDSTPAEASLLSPITRRPRATGLRRARLVTRSLAACCAAAVIAAAVFAVAFTMSNDHVASLEASLRSPERAAVQAALTTPGHRVAHLRADDGSQLAELVLLPDGLDYLIDDVMPPVPAGKTYELWAQVGGRMLPIGLLGRNPRSAAFTVQSAPAPTAFAVTVEPSTGTIQPTTTPVGAGSV